MADAPRVPPRFVPTLTEVVAPGEPARPETSAQAVLPVPPSARGIDEMPSPAVGFRPPPSVVEDEILHAVMQRVDALLEQRLQAVVAASVEAQLPLIAARLRGAVEATLRRTVADALADELQRRTGNAP